MEYILSILLDQDSESKAPSDDQVEFRVTTELGSWLYSLLCIWRLTYFSVNLISVNAYGVFISSVTGPIMCLMALLLALAKGEFKKLRDHREEWMLEIKQTTVEYGVEP